MKKRRKNYETQDQPHFVTAAGPHHVRGYPVRLRRREAVIRAQEPRSYRRSLRILRGNPSAAARGFGEALETLRELTGRR